MTRTVELIQLSSLVTVSNNQVSFGGDIVVGGDILTTGNTIVITADELSIEDKNITLASGSANSAVADGAGITIDGAGATLNYVASGDRWQTNKDFYVGGNITASGNNLYLAETRLSTGGNGELGIGYGKTGTGNIFAVYDNTVPEFAVARGGNVGIGTNNPGYKLDVQNGASNVVTRIYTSGSIAGQSYQTGTGHFRWSTQNNAHILYNEIEGHVVFNVNSSGDVSVSTGDLTVQGDVTANQYNNDEVRHSVRPTLNLDFANTKELDSRITFHRNSIATYYDSKGVLRYANANEPRFDHDPLTGESKGLLLEEARTNSKPYSEHMHKQLGADLGGHWVANYAKAPNGKYEASALFGTSGNASSRASTATLGANTYTYSFYAKDNGSGRFSFWAYSGGWVYSNGFEWQPDGTLVMSASHDGTFIELVGDGWARVSVTWTTSGNGSFQLSPGFYANYQDGDSTLFWGGCLEIGAQFATSYIPTKPIFYGRSTDATYFDKEGVLRTASRNDARYSHVYDGRKWVETGLILENAVTNILAESDFSNWASTSGLNNSEIVGLDGSRGNTLTISKIAPYNIYITQGGITSGDRYVVSVYAKAGTTNQFRFGFESGTTAGGAYQGIDDFTVDGDGVAAGNVVSGISSGIQNVGNGWYRCWVSAEANATSVILHASPINDGDTVHLFGGQLETGFNPTSLVYSKSGSVTRAADVSEVYSTISYDRQADFTEINGQAFESFYNQDEGTFYYEASSAHPTNDTGGGRFGVSYDDQNANRIMFNLNSTSYKPYIATNNVLQASVGASLGDLPGPNVMSKGAFSLSESRTITYIDGNEQGQDNNLILPIVNKLKLSNPTTDGDFICGHIKKLAYYPEALTDAELQALTENN